ncbi:MAG: hypothetical protein E7327_07335 [Clostridiales bacterium]|nr:hypothetical protein [Clostridiales bacterium]
MTKRRHNLFAAAAASVSSLLWLTNCVVDMVYRMDSYREFGMHVLLTVVWGICAALWWYKWSQS